MRFAWQAQGFRQVAKYVAGAGVREGCKNVGRRGGFEKASFLKEVSHKSFVFELQIFEGSLAEKLRF